MRSYRNLVVVLVIIPLAIDGTEARYGRLNNYLTSNVGTDDIGANIEAASQWLKEQEATKHPFLSKAPIRDLRAFTALQQVIGDTKCDRNAHAIIRKCEKAVGLHKLLRTREELRRTEKVMLEIFKSHAEGCSRIYPETYRMKIVQLDQTKLDRARSFARVVMSSDRFKLSVGEKVLFNDPGALLTRYVLNAPKIKDFKDDIFHDALEAAQDDPDFEKICSVPDEDAEKVSAHLRKIKELIRIYLVEPCQYIVEELGPDLFVPAEFDLQVYPKTEESEDYYRGWSTFMICRAIIGNERTILHSIIRTATS